MKDLAQLLELPPGERLQLVAAIWDRLVEVPEAVPVSAGMRAELDRRLAAYYADPDLGSPWEEIKAELLGDTHPARRSHKGLKTGSNALQHAVCCRTPGQRR